MKTQSPYFIGLLLLTAFFILPQTAVASDSLSGNKPILLLKGNSYFENKVAELVEARLVQQGHTVNIDNIKNIRNKNPKDYKAFILFSAVKTVKLLPYVKAYRSLVKDRNANANFLICNVYGEDWNGKTSSADAVTAATNALNPGEVAGNVVKNTLNAIHGKINSK